MTLSIHNSLTGSLELFSPQKPLHAGVYVCGPTVYDHAHIGHARSAIFFDVVVRYLRFRGYKVIYVRNFTDIDDKIIEKAGIENKTIYKLTEEYIGSYRFDMDCLGVHAPDHEPRVTDYIPQIIRAILILVDNNNAYANAGNVWFRTWNRPGYGLISGQNRKQDDTADSRLTISEGKEDSRDFALWKKSEPGSPSWQSPWGRGRPGWHIECAVMSDALLGTSFDIHGGGRDLIFPHHENERAISLALTECEPAKYWMHHALVTLNGRKLSKSEGSGPAYMIRDLCKKYSPEAIRLFLLSVHYRRQLDVTSKRILEKEKAVENLSLFIGKCRGIFDDETEIDENAGSLMQRVCCAMDDDFNIPESLGIIFECIRRLKHSIHQCGGVKTLSPPDKSDLKSLLLILNNVIGIPFDDNQPTGLP